METAPPRMRRVNSGRQTMPNNISANCVRVCDAPAFLTRCESAQQVGDCERQQLSIRRVRFVARIARVRRAVATCFAHCARIPVTWTVNVERRGPTRWKRASAAPTEIRPRGTAARTQFGHAINEPNELRGRARISRVSHREACAAEMRKTVSNRRAAFARVAIQRLAGSGNRIAYLRRLTCRASSALPTSQPRNYPLIGLAGDCVQRGYGATAARLTPDQKVGSSNLSALILIRALRARL